MAQYQGHTFSCTTGLGVAKGFRRLRICPSFLYSHAIRSPIHILLICILCPFSELIVVHTTAVDQYNPLLLSVHSARR